MKVPSPDYYQEFLTALPPEWPLSGLDHAALGSILEILHDNKLTLFPGYTDHSERHLIETLRWVDFLIPSAVRSASLLTAHDYAILIMATALHDVAMHIQPSGFLDLIGRSSKHCPVPWFRQVRGEQDWWQEWEQFLAEVKRFDNRKLTSLFGRKVAVRPPPETVENWELTDRLLAGEFIRRHHARLAHEIALYGFPGVPEDVFPGLKNFFGERADLIGAIARSHGLPLRDAKAYLESHHGLASSPYGVAATFHMALLRIADYLQLDGTRAPVILMHLRYPLGDRSSEEWAKHAAISYVGHHESDPLAFHVQVKPTVPYRTLVQLMDLFDSIQAELDTTAAVLRETYRRNPSNPYQALELSKTRATHNLNAPAFQSLLPYVPLRAEFRSEGVDLLYQLVQPLYSYDIGFGVRELVQNAIDAVRELETLCQRHPVLLEDLRDCQGAFSGDISLLLEQSDSGVLVLTIRDKGIGMTPEIVREFFLTAGRSYRDSDEWKDLFCQDGATPRVFRTGRFGIGVLAAFLLGSTVEVKTRHYSAPRGISFRASLASDLVELTWSEDATVGTSISIVLNGEASRTAESMLSRANDPPRAWEASRANEEMLRTFDWFTMAYPQVSIQVFGQSLIQRYHVPLPNEDLQPDWKRIAVRGFSEMQWSFTANRILSCNGILIKSLTGAALYDNGAHEIRWPAVSIIDPIGNLRLNLQRTDAFFDDDVLTMLQRSVMEDMLAYALVLGPTEHDTDSPQHAPAAVSSFDYPGLRSSGTRAFMLLRSGYAIWDTEVVSLLGVDRMLVAPSADISPQVTVSKLPEHTAFRADPDAWVDIISNAVGFPDERLPAEERALGALYTGGVTHRLNSLPWMTVTDCIILVSTALRDKILAVRASSQSEWHYRLRKLSLYEVEIRAGWHLLRTHPSVELRSDPDMAIAHVNTAADGHSGFASCEFCLRCEPTTQGLRQVWHDLIGADPIPYSSGLRRSQLERTYSRLEHYIGAWESLRRRGNAGGAASHNAERRTSR